MKIKALIRNRFRKIKSLFGVTRILSANRYPGVTFGRCVQITGVSEIMIKKGSCIGDNVWLNSNVRGNGITMNIGECVLIGRNSICSSCSKLEIGDYTFTNGNVLISNSLHSYDDIHTLYINEIKDCGELVIEENVWISYNAVVYGNINIGRGSVIGANCVVNNDIPPFSLVVGNPYKIIKMYDPVLKCWCKISNTRDFNQVLKTRLKYPLPSRDEYRKMLALHFKMKKVDPLCAGRGKWY